MLASSGVRPPRSLRLTPQMRSALLLLLDAALTTGSVLCALLLRFDGEVPANWVAPLVNCLPLLLALRLLSLAALGLQRWSFHGSGLYEAMRLALANVIATVVLELLRPTGWISPLPRSVVAMELFLTTGLMVTARFGPRMVWLWRMDRRRAQDQDRQHTLIVGAGNAGELLLHDLLHSAKGCHHVVGLVDDDPVKHGTFLSGKPVLGPLAALPTLVARYGVSRVLIAIPQLAPERIRELLALCQTQHVSFKIVPASFTEVDHRVTAAMLHDLSPEHLLPRNPVAFEPQEVHRLVSGRRILITGAGGSIGSELARQVAAHEPAALVLLDINENELYLLVRHLEERYPRLGVRAVVADIRDGERLMRLGEEHRPDYVFHAAAHKHVPLMEGAPEEAIKNNVFGTLNLARMADACGAQRFVLISTDKAVNPSSVMGASKRLAEMAIRDFAQRSDTAFTAVRFGNVLGSAGSVVPLFKRQIQSGGPVTVTHPDCTRYFMTIPEAVGLVLLAGLGGYGELCILDMGAPVRIAELASNMITMAGLVPGRDIPIVYTGLRPGEKLVETLLTEEEESTQHVHDRICAAQSPAPPADLQAQLQRLWRLAHDGDATGVKLALRALIPTYTPEGLHPVPSGDGEQAAPADAATPGPPLAEQWGLH